MALPILLVLCVADCLFIQILLQFFLAALIIKVATNIMRLVDPVLLRNLFLADLHTVLAARMELTAGGRIGR